MLPPVIDARVAVVVVADDEDYRLAFGSEKSRILLEISHSLCRFHCHCCCYSPIPVENLHYFSFFVVAAKMDRTFEGATTEA